jgi:hypothetical protein
LSAFSEPIGHGLVPFPAVYNFLQENYFSALMLRLANDMMQMALVKKSIAEIPDLVNPTNL